MDGTNKKVVLLTLLKDKKCIKVLKQNLKNVLRLGNHGLSRIIDDGPMNY